MESPWKHPKVEKWRPHMVAAITADTARRQCRSKGLISDDQKGNLDAVKLNSSEHNEMLLSFLSHGNLESFKLFLDILRDTEPPFNFATMLEDLSAMCDEFYAQPDSRRAHSGEVLSSSRTQEYRSRRNISEPIRFIQRSSSSMSYATRAHGSRESMSSSIGFAKCSPAPSVELADIGVLEEDIPNAIPQRPESAQQLAESPVFFNGMQVNVDIMVASDQRCSVCHQILCKPMQISCGHRFCQSCLERIKSGLDPRCPQDHQPIGDAFPDRHCERDIACIPVRCGNLTNCTWRGMLKDLEEHRRGCAFEKVACTNAGCGQTVERRHHTEHVTKTCPHSHATVTCQYCNQSIPTHQQTVHLNDCQEAIVNCSSEGCGKKFARKSMQFHLVNECDVMEIQRASFATATHITSMHAKMQSMEQQLQEKNTIIENLQQRLTQVQQELRHQFGTSLQALDSSANPLPISTDESHTARQERALQSDELDLDLENPSYDGTLVWRIKNFSNLLRDAKDEKKTSWLSPPFYTDRYGYKVCAVMYPNGGGRALGAHISLFCAIMRGDFDAVLDWPFNKIVHLTILDQAAARRHVSEAFLPDLRSGSFQRPTSEMNIASGCPCFISHEFLFNERSQYLQDDTIFFKVEIKDRPKTK
eukprot:scpid51535/ scgid3562/ TNF receptor-associated factor 3; CAP-1; CD40 receptor-associated factor 1; CD40-binding protein; LMP1-associated protein 1